MISQVTEKPCASQHTTYRTTQILSFTYDVTTEVRCSRRQTTNSIFIENVVLSRKIVANIVDNEKPMSLSMMTTNTKAQSMSIFVER